MRIPSTQFLTFAALLACGLSSCSKKTDTSMMPSRLLVRQPSTEASYKLNGKLIVCNAVVYPPFPVPGGEQVLVRLFTKANVVRGDEFVDLCFIKQPTKPKSTYKPDWARYNNTQLRDGAILFNNAMMVLTEGNNGSYSGIASGTALDANPFFSSITDVTFTNTQIFKN